MRRGEAATSPGDLYSTTLSRPLLLVRSPQVGSHCIGNKKLSVDKKHASRAGGFCYSFVDARNPGPYNLFSYSFGTGDPKIGPVIVEICKRTNVPLYLQY